MPKTHFENLKVYQLAEKLADKIWEIVTKWDQLPKYTVGQQIVKSADSIGSCIAKAAVGAQRKIIGDLLALRAAHYTKQSIGWDVLSSVSS